MDLHRELEEFVSKDMQLKVVEGDAGAAFYKAQADYDRVLAEFQTAEANTADARGHMQVELARLASVGLSLGQRLIRSTGRPPCFSLLISIYIP